MPGRDVIVIGGSAGSLGPLTVLLTDLPASFQACVLVAVHSSAESPGYLARILDRDSRLPVSFAVDGQPLERGVFVAPPDHHLVVGPGGVHVTLGPKENGFRPA